jgi:hypothetical protein
MVMQITFERSGGFAGLITTTTVDTTTLPAPEANRICLLVKAANFFELPSEIAPDNQPDCFQYHLTIQEGSQHHTVVVGESTMPGELRPLIDCLMEEARKGR